MHTGEQDNTRRGLLRSRIDAFTTAIGRGRTAASERVHRMHEEAAGPRQGTRKRSLVGVVAGLLGIVAMFTAVSQNVMAVNFTTSNTKFKIYSNYLDAQKAAGFLAPTTKQDGNQQGVAELGIAVAKLSGLCGITSQTILGQSWSLMLTAGDPVPDASAYDGTKVPDGVTVDSAGRLTGTSLTNALSANELYINADALTGYGNQISGLNLGQSAETVAGSAGFTSFPSDNGGTTPVAGNFGLYANQLNVAGLGADSFGLNLKGAITLPKLKLKLVSGTPTQDDCS